MATLSSLVETAALVGFLYAPIAIGLAISFRVLNYPDLTCEGSAMLGGAAAFLVLHQYSTVSLSLVVAFLCGAAAGALTASLHCFLRVSRLLSGIITSAILYSITIRMLGGRSNLRATLPTLFESLNPGNSSLGDLLIAAACVALVVGVSQAILSSRTGSIFRALGDEERFVVALGRNPRSNLLLGLAFSNGIVGLGGGILSHFKRVCDVNMSFGLLIGALAAITLGEAMCRPRSIALYLLTCVLGSVVYNLAIASVYFTWDTPFSLLVVPSDVRLITGVLLIGPAIVALRLPARYRLFNSDW